jgi:hypothetical protein
MTCESIAYLNGDNLESLIEILRSIPDNELIGDASQSQIHYFIHLRTHFNEVSKAISRYFLGKSMFDGLDLIERRNIEHELDHWLRFYDLLQWGWNLILNEASKRGWDIDFEPGDALYLVLRNHAEYLFRIHQSDYLEFNPTILRKQLNISPILRGVIDALENNRSLTEEQKQAIEKMKEIRQKGEHIKPELNIFFNFCIRVFEKNKNHRDIKHKYRDYLRAQGEYEAIVLASLHPRKKPQGWIIVNQTIHAPP